MYLPAIFFKPGILQYFSKAVHLAEQCCLYIVILWLLC